MSSSVYDKTAKGREEIATRKHQIPARMRTLLLLVDGRRTLEWLLTNVAGLGLGQQHLDELLAQEFISLSPATAPQRAVAPAATAAAPAVPAVPAVSPAPAAIAPAAGGGERVDHAAPVIDQRSDAERIPLLHAFYNRSIKAAIGLRGVRLQLRVEKAEGIDGMRQLRMPFLEAVIKAKGGAVALAMRDELDALLGGAPDPDEVVIPLEDAPAHGAFDFFNMASGAVDY